MSEDMDFEKKDDVEVKEILDDKNSDIQVKKSKLIPILLALLYGTALYGFVFSIIANIMSGGLAIDFSISLFIIFFIMFFVVMILQIRGIVSAAKMEDIDYCLSTYFLYKYITAPFIWSCGGILYYIVFNWVSMIINTPHQLVVSFLVFFFIIFTIVIVPYLVVSYALIELPCTIAVNCMLDITRKKCGMSFGIMAIHFFLQLIPIVNIIDGLYISIKYWKKGRILAIVTAVYNFIIIAIIAFIYSAMKSLGW